MQNDILESLLTALNAQTTAINNLANINLRLLNAMENLTQEFNQNVSDLEPLRFDMAGRPLTFAIKTA